MSSSVDPHDPRFELDRQDNIVLAALGEPVEPVFDAHRHSCEQCQAELAAFADTVRLARESGEHRGQSDATPAASVWAGIAAGLSLSDSPKPRKVRRGLDGSPRWKLGLAAVAVSVLAVTAAGLGYATGQRSAGGRPPATATARLQPMPGGPAAVAGTATLRATAHGDQLAVSTRGLPLRPGYYEVWMFNPAVGQMVALGTLAEGGAGTFPVPPGLDPHAYHVVDVSAQDYDGNPVHKQSVLRGPLTQ